MTGVISESSEFFPIQGAFDKKSKTFTVGDVTINKIATGKFGQLQKTLGKAYEMKITEAGKERTIYIRKSQAKKLFELLQKPMPSSDKMSGTLAMELQKLSEFEPHFEHIGLNSQDLRTLKAAVEIGEQLRDVTIDGKIYTLKTAKLLNDKFQFIIQEKDANPKSLRGKIFLTINPEGKIASLQVDGLPSNELPEYGKNIFDSYFQYILQSSTKFDYNPVLNLLHVTTLPRSPQQLPLHHLKVINAFLKRSLETSAKPPTLEITFLSDDLTEMEGLDVGGLARAYNDALFTGAAQHMLLQPFSTTKAAIGTPLADVKGHRNEYDALGRMYWFCWQSKSGGLAVYKTLLTGAHFSDDLFKLVFSLSFEELTHPLSADTRKRLNDLVLQSASGKTNASLAIISFCRDEQKVRELLDNKHDKLIPMEKLVTCKEELEDKRMLARTLRGPAKQAAQKEIDDLQEIMEKSSHLMDMCASVAYLENTPFSQMDSTDIYPKLYNALQKAPGERTREENKFIDALKGALKIVASDENIDTVMQEQGLDLEAISAIAFGLVNQSRFDPDEWDTFRGTPPSQFSDKVQGSVTREKIAACIHPDTFLKGSLPPALNERIGWIKEWITKDATEEETKQFLRWATGTTGVTENGIACRVVDHTSPYPTASTCDCEVKFSSPATVHPSKRAEYETKEGFISFLKHAMQNIDFSLV